MKTLWARVNNLTQFGRWAFEEFTDVFEIEARSRGLWSVCYTRKSQKSFNFYVEGQ